MIRALSLTLILLSSLAWAQKNPALEKAQLLLGQRKYAEALKALEAAERKGGMDRESYLTLLESKGLALASTNKPDKAEEAFRSVLILDPKRELSGKYSGAVGTPITAAIAWARQNGALELVALEPGVAEGKVKQLTFAVKNDPLKLVKAVTFYLRVDGGAWKPQPGALTNGAATLDVDTAAVDWWAETQDGNGNQVAFLASALRPVKSAAPAVVATQAPAPEAVKPVLTPAPKPEPVAVVSEPVASGSPLRTVGYVVGGVGLASLAAGVVLGLSYSSERAAIKDALANGSATQASLYERDQAAIRTAFIANTLVIAGSALAAGGVVLWLVGGPSSSTSAGLAPLGANGLAVTGTF